MIAILLYSLLFIVCLVYTLIPPAKKFLAPWFQSLHHQDTPPKQDSVKPRSTGTVPATEIVGCRDGLRGLFLTFDKNNDGYITKQELRESLEKMGIWAGERDVEDMVEKVDFNGDGLIDFDEFCKLYESINGEREAEGGGGDGDGDLREAFDVFDGNKDGQITVEELGLVLSSLGFSEGKMIEDCKEMIKKVDIDGDGMVNFDEFKMMLRDGLGRLIAVS